MQIKDVRPEPFVKQIRCDRCDRLADMSEPEFHEFVSIDLLAGYGSIFGDGNDVQIDLCQHCLKDSLGAWLRVSPAGDRQRHLEELLRRFDPGRHAGEFPNMADASLQEPEDLPPQDRRAWTTPLDHRRRMTPVRQIMRSSLQLFFAPVTGSMRGIRQECQRLSRLGRVRRRMQAELVRRAQAAIERSEAAGDWASEEAVIARLRAKVDEARVRRSPGFLKGKFDAPPNFDDDLPGDVLQDFEGGIAKDSEATVRARMQSDPGFALALIDEAIELASNGEHEVAKRILLELLGTDRANPVST